MNENHPSKRRSNPRASVRARLLGPSSARLLGPSSARLSGHARISAIVVSVFIAACIAGFLCAGHTRVAAQSGDSSDWDSRGSSVVVQCIPHCRSGYECAQGECIPVCNPGCGPGFLCSAGGNCVRMAPPVQTQPAQVWSAPINQCLPSCRTGYVCVTGQCVSACNPICPVGEMCTEHGECVTGTASTEPVAQPEDSAKEARSSSADSIVNLHFDAAGLLQFGLTPTVEVGKRFTGYFKVRPLNTGLASYFLLARRDGESFDWGVGGSLGMHVFSAGKGNMRGVFGGPSVEYAFSKTSISRRSGSYGTHALIPELDLGYRWGFDSFLLGLGGRIGLSIPIGAFDHGPGTSHCSGAGDCDRSLYFLAGAFVDVGWFL